MIDIKNEKYALANDKLFGKISKVKKPNSWVRSTCGYCGVGCGLYIGVKDGKATYTKGDPAHPVNMGTLCPKGLCEHQVIRADNRILSPLVKKNGNFKEVEWHEAFGKVSNKFKEIAKKHGKSAIACLSTGQLLTEEFYALGKFVQLGLGTNSYDGNTTLCMSSVITGYKQSLGSDGPPGCYEDFSHADVIMLIGANIADNQPILKLHIAKNRKITGKKPTIIVIDPRYSKTANMADIFVPLKPRSDLAFINTLCYIIWEQNWVDSEFIKEKKVSGYDEFIEHIQNYTPKKVSNITGIEIEELYKIAKVYAKAKTAMSVWTMGINQSAIGTDSVSAICNLALMTGNIAKEGASAFSITGQCNAMGTRECGFTSSIPGYRDFKNLQDRHEYASLVDVPVELVPTQRGYTYPQIVEAIERGEIKALWVVGTNPIISFPNQNRFRKALEKLELLVVQDSFMGDSALMADVIFSAATWGEKEGVYTNSERRCNLAKKALEPLGKSKSDFDIILEFSKYFDDISDMLFKDWSSPVDAFNEWKKVSSGRLCDYSSMSYEKIEKLGGIQWPCNKENPNGTKRLYTKEMSAKFICTDWVGLEEDVCNEFDFILNSGRTVEHFHTRTKTGKIEILNNLAPKAWIELNPKDAIKLKVKNGDKISIASSRGKVDGLVVKVTECVREKNVFVPFHFNTELINILTGSFFDPKSHEPNLKQTAVKLIV